MTETERLKHPPTSADAVKPVDAYGDASFRLGCADSPLAHYALEIREARDAARAALLDYIAGQAAEIERLTRERDEFAERLSKYMHGVLDLNTRAEKAEAKIERLNGQVTFRKGTADDFAAWVDRERAEKAELARIKAAQVPEELRQTMASVDRLWAAPPSALWACFDFVRSLLASEAAPAQASLGDALREAAQHLVMRVDTAAAMGFAVPAWLRDELRMLWNATAALSTAPAPERRDTVTVPRKHLVEAMRFYPKFDHDTLTRLIGDDLRAALNSAG